MEGENNDSCEWFFIELKKCLGLDEDNVVALISYEHQAIINVVAYVLPHVEHKHCVRHNFAN